MAKVNPKSKRSQIADLAVQIADHQARLQVIAANWGEEINEQLNAAEKAFLVRLSRELKGFKFNPNAKETLDRLKKITAKLNAIRKAAYDRAEEKVWEEARKLAENETKWGKRITKEMSEPDVKLKDASPALLDKVVKFGLADGKTLQEYFSGIADADAVRIESSIRQGVESGWTIDQIARNLAGTAEGKYKDGIFETSRKSAINMARTLCNAVSNNAKDAFYNANSDVINGVEILATLDGRTCPVCAGLDRKRYPIGENHPALPVHHSCRCVLLPVTPLSDMVEEERPMAKSDFMRDAKENYKKRFPNKDFDKLADSTKKKYYYEAMRLYEQRTGEPAYTQVAGGVSFKDYFTEHMTDEQRKKWLGPERFAIWKRGNLPLDKFIPPYPDKRLTVDALKAEDKKSFAKNAKRYEASPEAIKFARDNIAKHVDVTGLSAEALDVLSRGLLEKMQKYGLDKLEELIPTEEDVILGVRRDNKRFQFNAATWSWIVKHPQDAFREYITKSIKKYGLRQFAINSPEEFVSHTINHEIGHMIFNRSKLKNKEALLVKLWEKTNTSSISRRAHAHEREFFAESFALYERGVILDDDVRIFIEEVLK